MLAKLEVHIVSGNKYLGGSAEVINAISAGGSSSNLKLTCSFAMPKETVRLSGEDIFEGIFWIKNLTNILHLASSWYG